jgi:hypothetical protein
MLIGPSFHNTVSDPRVIIAFHQPYTGGQPSCVLSGNLLFESGGIPIKKQSSSSTV